MFAWVLPWPLGKKPLKTTANIVALHVAFTVATPLPSPQSFKPSDMVSSLFCYGTNDENLIDYMISFLIGSIIPMAYTFIKR